MRVNIYAEEMTDRIEIVEKEGFTGLRLYLYLPVTGEDGQQHQGPFMHRDGDDDSSAITFWGKRSMMRVLRAMQAKLAEHYASKMGISREPIENKFGLQVLEDGLIEFTNKRPWQPQKWINSALRREDAINLAAWITFLPAGEAEIRQELDKILMQKAGDQNANS